MRGMGEGPYSREGFLSGWNFGNLFCLGRALSSDPNFPAATMPADELHATRDWNYLLSREKIGYRWYVPRILFRDVEGHPCRVAMWPEARPISLPKVDYVLLARVVGDEIRCGLATWAEIVEVARAAGFDAVQDRLDLHYNATPVSISTWVRGVALIDRDAVRHLDPQEIIDEELIAAARARIERDAGGPDYSR